MGRECSSEETSVNWQSCCPAGWNVRKLSNFWRNIVMIFQYDFHGTQIPWVSVRRGENPLSWKLIRSRRTIRPVTVERSRCDATIVRTKPRSIAILLSSRSECSEVKQLLKKPRYGCSIRLSCDADPLGFGEKRREFIFFQIYQITKNHSSCFSWNIKMGRDCSSEEMSVNWQSSCPDGVNVWKLSKLGRNLVMAVQYDYHMTQITGAVWEEARICFFRTWSDHGEPFVLF